MTTKKMKTKTTEKPKSTKESPKAMSKTALRRHTKKPITASSTTLHPTKINKVILTITDRDDTTATVHIQVDPENVAFDELVKSPSGALSAALLQILSGLFDYDANGLGQNSIFKGNVH